MAISLNLKKTKMRFSISEKSFSTLPEFHSLSISSRSEWPKSGSTCSDKLSEWFLFIGKKNKEYNHKEV